MCTHAKKCTKRLVEISVQCEDVFHEDFVFRDCLMTTTNPPFECVPTKYEQLSSDKAWLRKPAVLNLGSRLGGSYCAGSAQLL